MYREFSNCTGIREDNWSAKSFCYFFNNSDMVTDTIVGKSQNELPEFSGSWDINKSCNGTFFSSTDSAKAYKNFTDSDHKGNAYDLITCKEQCMNYRLEVDFVDNYFYCCTYHKQYNSCQLFGTDSDQITLENGLQDNILQPEWAYYSMIDFTPRNLKPWNIAGVRISSQCQGQTKSANTTNISIEDCLTNHFRQWIGEQTYQSSFCAKYFVDPDPNQNICEFQDNCDVLPLNTTDKSQQEFCYTVGTSMCQIIPESHSQTDNYSATLEQSECFSVEKFKIPSTCGDNQNIQYTIIDLQGYSLTNPTNYYLYQDNKASLDGGQIHVCPKDLTNATTIIPLKIQASYISMPDILVNYTWNVIDTIKEGYHSNEGFKKEAVGKCKNAQGYDFLTVADFGTALQLNKSECLKACLDFDEHSLDYHDQNSLYCCQYRAATDKNDECMLVGNSDVRQRREDHIVLDDNYTNWIGVIPKNTSNQGKGGWRWDAYCSGDERQSQSIPGGLESCKHWAVNETQIYQNLTNPCIQYKADSQNCYIFENCDTRVGSLDGFFCYNPGYMDNEVTANVNQDNVTTPVVSVNKLSAPNIPNESRNYTVGEEPAIYQFDEFPCQNCNSIIVYQITFSQEDNLTYDNQSLLMFEQNLNDSPPYQIQVNTSREAKVNFEIYGYLDGLNEINVTSETITITIIELPTPQELKEFSNLAPQFTESIDSEVVFDELFPDNQGAIFALPDIWDENDSETVQVRVEGLEETYSSFDYENHLFYFFNLSESKNLSIQITLIDLEGQSSQTKINFHFEIQPVIDKPKPQTNEATSTFAGVDVSKVDQELNRQDTKTKEEEVANLTCEIKYISSEAEVLILFSEPVEQFNKSYINTSSLQIKVIPSDLFEESSPERLSKLGLSWNVLQFYSNKLYLQLKFENPLQISSASLDQDWLKIHFLSNSSNFFKAENTKKALDPNYSIQKKIRPQNVDSKAAKNFAIAADEAAGYMNKSFWLIYLITQLASNPQTALAYIQLINALQMIMYLPATNIRFPGNAMQLITSTQPIAQFDPLDGVENTKFSPEEMDIWDEDDTQFEQQGFQDQMVDLGLESLNSILNLGSLSFFLTLYILKNSFFIFLKFTLVKYLGWFTGPVGKQLRNAIFNEIILLTIESSLDIFVAGYLQSLKQDVSWQFFGDAMSSILGYICLLLICLMPLLSAHVIRQTRETKESDQFKDKYGAFYESVSTRNRFTVSYNMVFVLRRTIFCFALFAIQSPACQFQLIYFNNLFYSIYFFYHRPKTIPHLQFLEMLNELLINIITLHMIPFTDMGPDPETQSSIGYSMCVFLCILQALNVSVCIYFFSKDIYLVSLRHYRRLPIYKNKVVIFISHILLIGLSAAEKKFTVGANKAHKDSSEQSSSSSSESSSSLDKGLNAPRHHEFIHIEDQFSEEVKEEIVGDLKVEGKGEPPIDEKNHMLMMAETELKVKDFKEQKLKQETQIDVEQVDLPTKKAEQSRKFFEEAKPENLVEIKVKISKEQLRMQKGKISYNQWKTQLTKKNDKVKSIAAQYSKNVDAQQEKSKQQTSPEYPQSHQTSGVSYKLKKNLQQLMQQHNGKRKILSFRDAEVQKQIGIFRNKTQKLQRVAEKKKVRLIKKAHSRGLSFDRKFLNEIEAKQKEYKRGDEK